MLRTKLNQSVSKYLQLWLVVELRYFEYGQNINNNFPIVMNAPLLLDNDGA